MLSAQNPKPYNDFSLSLRGGKPIWQTTHDTVRHNTKIEVCTAVRKLLTRCIYSTCVHVVKNMDAKHSHNWHEYHLKSPGFYVFTGDNVLSFRCFVVENQCKIGGSHSGFTEDLILGCLSGVAG